MRILRRAALALGAAALSALALAAPAGAVHYLYSINDNAPGTTSGFTIGGGAALTPIADATEDAGSFPIAGVVSPDGKHLYVSSFRLYGFNIAADGSLSAMPGSPFGNPFSYYQLAITPDGSKLYAPGGSSNAVFGFSLAADGTPTELPGSPYATGANFAFGLAITPNGQRVYSSNANGNSIAAFNIGANGALTAIAGSPFAAGASTSPEEMGMDPGGSRFFVANSGNGTVGSWTINGNGSITQGVGSPFPADTGAWGATVSPDAKNVYVGNQTAGNVRAFNNNSGSLSAVTGSPFAAGAGARTVAITPDGSAAFVANLNGDSITRYTRNTSTGALTVVPPVQPAGNGATGLAIPPNQPPTADFAPTLSDTRDVQFQSTSSEDDSPGGVASFSWDFGDGATASTPDPTVTHTFPADGVYNVRLTTTDTEGCGPTPIYNGQSFYCNGGPAASKVQQVTVDTVLSGAKFKAKKTQKQKPDKGKVTIKAKAGAAEKVLLSVGNGKVKVPGAGKVKLKKVKRTEVAAGKLKTLKLKPSGKKGTKAILAAIAAGGKPKASFKVTLTDDAGNVAAKTLKVTLK